MGVGGELREPAGGEGERVRCGQRVARFAVGSSFLFCRERRRYGPEIEGRDWRRGGGGR